MNTKIAIIGCGFAGASSARQFCRFKKETEVVVMDRKETFDFLPMLPDIVGRGITSEFLTFPIKLLSERWGFNFINEEVKSVDVDKNIITTGQRKLNYDYLIISSGSETNFYGNEEIKKCAYKIDDVRDARTLLEALKKNNFDYLLIAGGGYTGIEIATSLRAYLNRASLSKKIIIVERSSSILGPLPEWIKRYVYNNLQASGIEVMLNTVINKASEGIVSLSGGQVFNNALLIWVAGVRTPEFVQNLNAENNPQGRIKVDEYLRLKENCFIIGDSAYVWHKSGFLRMAVQFAIYQAVAASRNIMRSIKGLKLIEYRPIDLGYIIPMANNDSCGSVMGVKVTGWLATMMHFTMCVYRSLGLKNRAGITKNVLEGGGR